MTWRILGPLAGAVAVVTLAVVLLAPNNGTALDPVAQAADATTAAGSAAFGMAGTMTVGGQTLQIKGNGAVDMVGHRMRMSMSVPVPGFGDVNADEIFDGSAFYMHFPDQLMQKLPGAKPWMKLDLQALGKRNGVDFKQLIQANQSNPDDLVKALKGVGSSEVVGHENVNGAPTTHYKATIDLDKALSKISDKQTADALEQTYAQAGVGSMPIDVWIDRENRVRRESMKFSAGAMSLDMTVDFLRFGVPVDTTPPPADQTMDLGAQLGASAPDITSG